MSLSVYLKWLKQKKDIHFGGKTRWEFLRRTCLRYTIINTFKANFSAAYCRKNI
jgi:hypothetical protein